MFLSKLKEFFSFGLNELLMEVIDLNEQSCQPPGTNLIVFVTKSVRNMFMFMVNAPMKTDGCKAILSQNESL